MWRDKGKSIDPDTLITFGGAVKALGDGRVGGYLVRYGNADELDLEQEYFTAKTDYGSAQQSDVYYNHGLDAVLGRKRLGTWPLKFDDVGAWLEGQLDLRDAYEKAIYTLAEKGKLGLSSGTAPHLVEKKQFGSAWEITRWPLGLDASLTPTPAEPRNAAMPLKSWADTVTVTDSGLKVVAQEGEIESSSVTTTAGENVTVTVTVNQKPMEKATTTEVLKMSEQEKVTEEPRLDWQDRMEKVEAALAGKSVEMQEMEGRITDKLDGLLEALAKAPSLKDAGYISPDSEGTERMAQKSFGDWLIAVKNGNESRLTKVYGSTKALGEQSGTTGGYLVPEEYQNQIMMLAQDAAVIRPMATVLRVGSNRGSIPALNHTTAPTAGKGYSAFAGGVVATWTPEAGALDSTDPGFELIEFNINKLAGYTYVSSELMSDSAFSVEQLLSTLFARAISAKEDYSFIRGTGAGEPLGILAAPCTIGVTTNADNTWAMEDAMNMLAQFQPVGPSTSSIAWVMHRGVIPDMYGNFDVTTGGIDWAQPRESLPMSLLGYKILFSEHMPVDDTDDVILGDFSAYLIFDNQGLEISYSPHYRFTNDQGTWRFTKRLDGQPWLSNYITLADPGGAYYVSPFLYHND